MNLEQEIIDLTSKWYKYVNMDHHKDRDCHWYITKTYSYGNDPYYVSSHHGYVIEDWYSPECATEEMAAALLRNKLKKELEYAVVHLKDALTNQDTLDWFGQTAESVNKLIKDLQ